MHKNIAQIVVGLPVDGPFDYAIDTNLKTCIESGMRVKVQFNRRNLTGYVVGFKEKSDIKKLNYIHELLEPQSVLSQQTLRWTKKMSEFYGCSWGECIDLTLPQSLRKGKKAIPEFVCHNTSPVQSDIQNELICDPSLSHYWGAFIQKVSTTLKNDKSIIILVPERTYVRELVANLSKSTDATLCVLDKKRSVKEELEMYLRIRSQKMTIVVGTRSCVFTQPLDLGQIIIFEPEHDAYREEQSPYYHVSKVAEIRSQVDHCSLTFISPNPSIELWDKATRHKWVITEFQETSPAQVQVVDMTNYNPRKSSILSFPLQNNIQSMVEQKKKVLLYFNRKGFNTFTRCESCGHVMKCSRCDVTLTYVFSRKGLVCNKCGGQQELPKKCPHCKRAYLKSMGTGIEKLESELNRYYPYANIMVFDKDSKSFPKQADIILATSAVFYSNISFQAALVAIVQFDNEMNRSDFRSAHKSLSMLIRLKNMASEKIIIQTKMPDNECIQTLRSMDLKKFYRDELAMREELQFPPYSTLLAVSVRGANEQIVCQTALKISERVKTNNPGNIELYDPVPDIVPKLRDKFRYTLMLKGSSVENMLQMTKGVLKGMRRPSGIIVTIKVDI